MKESYLQQTQLMLRLLPYAAKEDCFALKGGTAINFFHRDMPRLSVDIDLTYMPIEPRDDSLRKIGEALMRMRESILGKMPGVKVQEARIGKNVSKLFIRGPEAQVKIEPNFVLRGSVHPPIESKLSERAQEEFGFSVSLRMLPPADLFAGKICAALDRQHPRDLFDIKLLLESEGITPEIRKVFVVYLASGPRPMHELIDPNRKDVQAMFDAQFLGMTDVVVTYEELIEAREALVAQLKADMTDEEKNFLVSIKKGDPQWKLLELPDIDRLPGIRWKLQNIEEMAAPKREEYLRLLKAKLEI